jgi:hypothetical protein
MSKIIHIVLWKLAPPPASLTSASEIAAHQKKVQDGIKKLLNVPGPLEGYVGPPKIADRAKGFDLGMCMVLFCDLRGRVALWLEGRRLGWVESSRADLAVSVHGSYRLLLCLCQRRGAPEVRRQRRTHEVSLA